MKLTFALLLLALLEVSATAIAQKVSITQRNTTLKAVLEEIRKQSGYEILYDAELIKKVKNISITVDQVSVDEALKKCLENQPFTSVVKNKTIAIIPNRPTQNAPGATLQIKGTINNDDNKPLPGDKRGPELTAESCRIIDIIRIGRISSFVSSYSITVSFGGQHFVLVKQNFSALYDMLSITKLLQGHEA